MSDSSKRQGAGPAGDAQSGRERFVQQLLDSYFSSRRNLPEKGYLQENKTTQQIQDELLPMCSVSADEIVSCFSPGSSGTRRATGMAAS